ncbi:MAG: hypothetical protein KIS87_14700 [Phycisphaeraceae bacterium]|nr:hypothetical protein [Phycisphaeraceae bacterium]
MTLLEVTLSIVIVAVIASVVVPVTASLGDAYVSAADTREAADDAAFALDRVVRLLREAPEGDVGGRIGIVRADANAVEFTDTRAVELIGTDLVLTDDDGMQGVLCRDVSVLEIGYLAADGMTDCAATPEETRRFTVRLVVRGVELRAAAFARVTIVQPGGL